ncbi:MAG: CPBP family intramembrane metalloprotease [bacterium]|nr:CPBP family intramembrane metalloprotease [bacterium]
MIDEGLPENPDLSALPPPSWPGPAGDVGVYLPFSNWSYGQTVLALLVGILVGPFAVASILTIVDGPDAIEDASTFLLLAAQAVSSLGIVFYLSRFRGSGSWPNDYGFSLKAKFAWGIAFGMGLQIAVALLTYPLIQWFAEDDGPQQEIARLATSLTGSEIFFFAIFVAVVAPIFEEIVFRGMLLGRLTKSMGRHPAVLISGAAFAATHLFDTNAILVVPGLFVVGVVLGYAALYAKNLSLPIYIHVGVNGLAVLLLTFSDELEELSESVESVIAPLLWL